MIKVQLKETDGCGKTSSRPDLAAIFHRALNNTKEEDIYIKKGKGKGQRGKWRTGHAAGKVHSVEERFAR